MLRDGADTGKQRDLLVLQTVGIGAAIPMFIESADGLCGALAHAKFSENAGSTIAVKIEQLLVVPMLRDTAAKPTGGAHRGAVRGQNILPEKFERCQIWPAATTPNGLAHAARSSAVATNVLK